MSKFVAILSLFISFAAFSHPPSSIDSKKILSVIFAMAKGLNERSATQLTKCFTYNASFVNQLGEAFYGIDEINSRSLRPASNNWSDLKLKESKILLTLLHIEVARAVIPWKAFQNTPHANRIRGIWTLILVKDRDAWRIASAHSTKIDIPPSAKL